MKNSTSSQYVDYSSYTSATVIENRTSYRYLWYTVPIVNYFNYLKKKNQNFRLFQWEYQFYYFSIVVVVNDLE